MDEPRTMAVGWRERWIGRAMILIGVIHCLFGFVFMGPVVRIVATEGFINTVNGEPKREAMFWFIYFGIALIILGGVVSWIESRRLPLPGFLPWAVLLVVGVGVIIMPASGFWLMAAPLAGMFIRRHTRQKADAAARPLEEVGA